jgi:hypothetical protein
MQMVPIILESVLDAVSKVRDERIAFPASSGDIIVREVSPLSASLRLSPGRSSPGRSPGRSSR